MRINACLYIVLLSLGLLEASCNKKVEPLKKHGEINVSAELKEWGQYNIRANVICPGLIQTKFSEALWANDKILQHVLEKVPLNRVGQPDEISGLALFLASDSAGYCTGSVFMADGGYLV